MGLVVRLLWRTGRDRELGAAGSSEDRRELFDRRGGPVQFRPPDDARPAQIGVLVDERADPLDVTATIVDLGVRGYLSMEETQKDGWFKDPDWKLTKLKDDAGELLTYEKRLFTGLVRRPEGGANVGSEEQVRVATSAP